SRSSPTEPSRPSRCTAPPRGPDPATAGPALPGLYGPGKRRAGRLLPSSRLKTPASVHKDDAMPDDAATIELSLRELREVAGYAAACARPALAIFERERPGDRRPRAAIDAAQAFAEGA